MEYWKKAAITMGLGTWTDSLDFACLMYAMPILILALNPSQAELALISAIPGYVGLFFSLLSGPLVDLFGRKKMWVIGNAVSGLAYLVGIWVCRNFIDLTIIRTIGQIGMAICIATYFSWLPEVVPADKRQTVMGLTGMLQVLSILTLSGFLALTGIFPWIGWQFMFAWTAAWDLALTVVGAIVLKEPEIWVERRKMRREGTLPKEEEKKVSYLALFSKKYRVPFIIGLLIGLTYSMMGLLNATGAFGSHFQTVVMQFPPWLQGTLGLVGIPLMAIYRPIIGRISDKIGRLKNLLIFNCIAFVTGLLGAFAPVIVGVGPYLNVILYTFILGQITNLGTGAQEDTGKLAVSEVVPTVARGTAQSFLEFVKQLVISTVTLVVGVIYAINPMYGMAFPIILGTIVGLSAVITAMKLGLETKGKALE